MKFVDDYKWAIDLIMHPSVATKKSMTLEQAFAAYYKVSLIPLVIIVLAELIVGSLIASFIAALLHASTTLAPLAGWVGGGVAVLAVLTVVFVWVFIPIGILVDSIIYYVFGKYIFRTFQGTFEGMATAAVYGIMPFVVLSWLFLIPILGFPILIGIAGLWEIIVLVYAISNQQKTSTMGALGTIIGTWVVLFILQILIAYVLH